MAPSIFPRQSTNSLPDLTTNISLYVVGFAIAGIVIFAILSWLFIRCYRRSMSTKRSEKRGGAFLHVRGVVPMMAETHINRINPTSTSAPEFFSRDRLTSSIIMPEKTLSHKPLSPGSSGKAPIASQLDASPASPPSPSPSPPSTQPASSPASIRSYQRPNAPPGSPRKRVMSILNPAHPRYSQSSSISWDSHIRFPPGLHTRESSRSSTSSSQARPVRQLFEPVMPDELSLVRIGEYLAVIQSFDDGWCIVARDTSCSSRSSILSSSRLSIRNKSSGDNIELGLVPAWVFVKPMKGLTVERPVRSASVNALQAGQDGEPSRAGVISWSNFA
ncbi:hypothetical protein BU15DRAFT_76669 [Melanogaster broomeanus]|nr:hypothetical protein BU15DRAFT_76669 [Melanogaster broomeanus]